MYGTYTFVKISELECHTFWDSSSDETRSFMFVQYVS
jgi:hypothetical protein